MATKKNRIDDAVLAKGLKTLRRGLGPRRILRGDAGAAYGRNEPERPIAEAHGLRAIGAGHLD